MSDITNNIQDDFLTRVRALAREVCEREECELYHVEFVSGPNGRILRVYIDRPQGDVSLEHCSQVSRGLNLLLDVEDIVPGGHYDLEVSSPGIERKLVESWHFERVLGQSVRIKLNKPATPGLIDGKLLKIDDTYLYIQIANSSPGKVKQENLIEKLVERALVNKAHVRFEPEVPQPPKGKKRGK